jgi:hypothetical protein
METPDQRGPEDEKDAVEPTAAHDPLTEEEPVVRSDTDTWSAAIIGAPTEPPPRVQGDFPIVFRGYEREAVDAHLAALEEEVIDLHATRSPQAAVKRELDRVGEETAAILKGAHEAADDIAKRSRVRADERVEEADREAERLRTEAEAHVRRLDRDTDEIWAERRKLLEDARAMGEALIRLADQALERFPPAEDGTAPRPDLAPPPHLAEVPPPADVPAAVVEADEPEEEDTTGAFDPPTADEAGTEDDPDVTVMFESGDAPEADDLDAEAAEDSDGIESVRKIPRPDAPRHPRRPGR